MIVFNPLYRAVSLYLEDSVAVYRKVTVCILCHYPTLPTTHTLNPLPTLSTPLPTTHYPGVREHLVNWLSEPSVSTRNIPYYCITQQPFQSQIFNDEELHEECTRFPYGCT